MKKQIKSLLGAVLTLAMVSTNFVSGVWAVPTIKVMVNMNGTLVEYKEGEIARGPVTMISDTACMWMHNGNSVSQDYETTKTISKAYSVNAVSSYSCVDANGNESNTVSFLMDYGVDDQVHIKSSTEEGATEVEVISIREGREWFVDGKSVGVISGKRYVITGKGTHFVYTVDPTGATANSNIINVTIPYSTQTTTTTTTTKKATTTTKKPSTTTTTTAKQVKEIKVDLVGVEDGGFTTTEVVVEADIDAYFVVNNKKLEKTAKSYTISEEGTYTVYATNATNTVNSLSYTFTIDRTSPTLKLSANGKDATEAIIEGPVTISASEQGYFVVNGQQANLRAQSQLVVADAGTYAVEFKDEAGNASEVAFTIQASEPSVTPEPSGNSGKGALYIAGGAILGGALVAIIMVIINRVKNKQEDDEDEE